VAKLSDKGLGRDRNRTKHNDKNTQIEKWAMPNQMIEADDVEELAYDERQQERDDGKD
jgi:hypothetical protein